MTTLLRDHFPLLVLLSTLISGFLALLWKEDRLPRIRLFGRILFSLVGGSIVAGWLMLQASGR